MPDDSGLTGSPLSLIANSLEAYGDLESLWCGLEIAHGHPHPCTALCYTFLSLTGSPPLNYELPVHFPAHSPALCTNRYWEGIQKQKLKQSNQNRIA